MNVGKVLNLFKEAAMSWAADNATRLSAALAYYSIFSLAPMLVITISLIAIFYGQEAAQGQIAGEIDSLVGTEAAEAIQNAIAQTSRSAGESWTTAIIGFATMIMGATTVFGELKNALNQIFGVKVQPGHAVTSLVRQRVLSFSIVLVIGFLLIVSLVISSVLSAVSTYLTSYLPLPPQFFKVLDFTVSLLIMTVLFGMIFKVLPNVRFTWRDVLAGGAVTSLLFNIGKSLIAYYLGTASPGSAFGAGGAVVLILLWVYFASGILFFGAEFTKAYVNSYGLGIVPNQYGELLNPAAEETEGQPEGASPPSMPPPGAQGARTVETYTPPPPDERKTRPA